jgi:hypothetical protein
MMVDQDDSMELPPRRNPGPPPSFASPNPANEDGIDIPPLRESAEEDENRRAGFRSRLGSFLLAAAMGGILMGGAFWWGFEVGKQNALEQTPPVVRADPSPIKEAPEDPGGLQVPHQDKLVLQDAEQDNGVEAPVTLAPQPEQPVAPPPRLVETDAARTVDSDQLPPPPPALRNVPQPLRPPPAAPQAETQAAVPPPPPIPTADGEEAAATPVAPAGTPPAQSQPAAAPQPAALAQTQAAAPAPATAPAPAPQQPAAAPAAGGFRVQLAAYRTPEAALAGWKALQARYEDLLGSLEPTVVRADLGDRGVFHRLQAGPYVSTEAANAACTALRARNQACLVIRP